MKNTYLLAIDQGTSSTKSLIFDGAGKIMARAVEPLHTQYAANGFVEQDPEDIFQNVLAAVQKCLADFLQKGYRLTEIAAMGISNQRETFVLWDKAGKPLHPAIVWQCKRSVQLCEQLKQQPIAQQIYTQTGLVMDPYFSATKLVWLAQQDATIQQAIALGQACFGTIDTWLLYRLTQGAAYATDYTNASRTMLFNLQGLQWDQSIVTGLGLAGLCLPSVQPSSSYFGTTDLNGLLPRAIPVTAMIGDSHAAAFGEGCFTAGDAKATLGTGCSILMDIGEKPLPSSNGMVTTVCWSTESEVHYALEGVIVSCGATLEWLKKELNLFTESSETETMARAVPDNGGVFLVPAFSGLGSPYWQMNRKASIHGLSFGSTKNHIVRAALESIPFQLKDVISAMQSDTSIRLQSLHINGGISRNRLVMQLIADLLDTAVTSSAIADISALGAALLAGLKAGVYKNIDEVKACISDQAGWNAQEERSSLQHSYEAWKEIIASSQL